MDAETAKRFAAIAAAELMPDEGVIGLGTGTTTRYFINEVGRLVGEGRRLVGVPTSRRSHELATSLGIPLLDDIGPWTIDVCVDGADEVSDTLDLLKGGGGAHTREKIVNQASRRNVILVDESKLSRRLGEKRALPVEVLAFGARQTLERLARHGTPTVRSAKSDAGNVLVDLATGPIDDVAALDHALRSIPGVVRVTRNIG